MNAITLPRPTLPSGSSRSIRAARHTRCSCCGKVVFEDDPSFPDERGRTMCEHCFDADNKTRMEEGHFAARREAYRSLRAERTRQFKLACVRVAALVTTAAAALLIVYWNW